MRTPTVKTRPSETTRYVKKIFNKSSFAADLESFNISADEEDPVALLAGYDTCLRTIVDAHAPLVSRTITVRPMTPRHTNDLTEEKRALRRAERLWRKSGLTVHRHIFTDRRNTFRKSLKTARYDYTIDPRSRKLTATCVSSIISEIHSLAEG